MSTLEFDQILENVKNRALDLRQSIAHFDLNTTWYFRYSGRSTYKIVGTQFLKNIVFL